MTDIRISLDVYSSDIASRVMNLTEEIPDEEIQDLKDFILRMLRDEGNPGVCEALAWGIRDQYRRWRRTRDWGQLLREKSDIYHQATQKRGHTYV